MITQPPQVNFKELVEKVLETKIGRDTLTILAGLCQEKELLGFLQQWKTKFPFRIWEYASEVVFEKNETRAVDINAALLERCRLFGDGGDLSMRREGSSFIWLFLGPVGTQAPKGNYDMQSYWSENNRHKVEKFHCYPEKTLLWGEWNGKRWHESRVAGANLIYPLAGKRVQLEYLVYSHAGQVNFVRYTGLSEWR